MHLSPLNPKHAQNLATMNSMSSITNIQAYTLVIFRPNLKPPKKDSTYFKYMTNTSTTKNPSWLYVPHIAKTYTQPKEKISLLGHL